MQTTSDLYKSIWSDAGCIVQTKVTIAGKDYVDGLFGKTGDIVDLSTPGSIFTGAGPSIGGAICREIDLELRTAGRDIPRAAEIRVFVRLLLADDLTETILQASEWIPKGVFYIDTRSLDVSEQYLTIHGYDAMLKGEQEFLNAAEGETGEWPQPMDAVARMCAEKMGVELDERSVLSSTYTISYPTSYTIRELLQHIAVAHAGNWIITDAGKLRLVVLGDIPDDPCVLIDEYGNAILLGGVAIRV